MKILNTIGDVYDEEAKKILQPLGEVSYKTIDQKELLDSIAVYDIVIIGLGLRFDKEVLDRATHLKVIATATTGLDHIDVNYAKEKDVMIISLRGENDFLDTITGTAELSLGLLLNVIRMVAPAAESVKRGEWQREKFRGHSLVGKTLGIVGLGRLGKMMARYGNGLGMNVIAYDPHIDAQVFSSLSVKQVDFITLIKESDAISLHVHLTQETEGMFTREVFGQMKRGVYLINTSRGKIVNETDIIVALEQGQVAGYATDVLANELRFGETFVADPLVEYAKTHQNVLIVPHIGGMTYESRQATDIFVANKVISWTKKHL